MHYMLDLETLGTAPTSAIISIGCCSFNGTRRLKVNVDREDAIRFGTTDASTLAWWAQQSDEAKAALLDPPPVALRAALEALSAFVPGNAAVWGNSSMFDNALIRHAYAAVGLRCPWSWRKDYCYRTLKALRPDLGIERDGVHHDSLSDALSQARHAVALFAALGVAR